MTGRVAHSARPHPGGKLMPWNPGGNETDLVRSCGSLHACAAGVAAVRPPFLQNCPGHCRLLRRKQC